MIILTTTLSIVSAVVEAASLASSPPNVCEMRQSVWCIYLGAVEIINQPSEAVEYRSVWTVRGELQPSKPYIVLEPRGCREGLSDVVELVSFDTHFKWGEKYWNRAVARLKSDKSCDLELLTPVVENNEISEGFFNSLNLIQACSTVGCDGPILGQRIRNLSDRLEIKKPWNDLLLNIPKSSEGKHKN